MGRLIAQAAGSRFRVLSFEEFQERPSPSWLVGDVLPARGQAILFGNPGEGKSFAAIDLALSVATGTSWHGRPVKQGAVLYIAAEGASGLTVRTQAWMRHHGQEEIPPAYFVADAPQLHTPADVGDLLRAIDAVPNMAQPVLVVADTFARTFVGGRENESQDVGLWIAGAAKIQSHTGGATFVALHHTKKQQRKGQVQERGSSALRGAADTMIAVQKRGKDVILSCEKQKDGEEFSPFSLQLQQVTWQADDGEERSSCVLVGSEALSLVSDYPPPRHLKILRLVVECGGEVETGGFLEKWKAAGEKERTFQSDKDTLIERGYLRQPKRGSYAITDEGRKLLQLH